MSDDGDCCYPIRDKSIPPPDAQAMTREMVLKIADKVFQHYPFKHELNYWLAHDAAQRETIARLEDLLESAKENERFLRDTPWLQENASLQARLTASEREVRKRMWTLHYSRMQHAPYGDDGRLDCNSCGRDYVATPMDELVQWEMLDASKLVTASEAKRKWTKKPPTEEGWYWWKHGGSVIPRYIHSVTQANPPILRVECPDGWFEDVDKAGGEWQGPLTPGEE